jgi:hypothetical protein
LGGRVLFQDGLAGSLQNLTVWICVCWNGGRRLGDRSLALDSTRCPSLLGSHALDQRLNAGEQSCVIDRTSRSHLEGDGVPLQRLTPSAIEDEIRGDDAHTRIFVAHGLDEHPDRLGGVLARQLAQLGDSLRPPAGIAALPGLEWAAARSLRSAVLSR